MSLSINGDGTLSGVTAIGDVSSTELDYVDGVTAPIQTQLNAGGLVYINTFTVTNAATLTQDNLFTSAYPIYRIYLNVLPITGNSDTYLRLRASGSDTTTAYFSVATGSDQSAVASNYGSANAAYGLVGLTGLNTVAERNTAIFDIVNPQTALETVWTGTAFYQNNSGIFINRSFGGFQDASTQFDGIKIYQSSGNITAIMKVWGYRG